MQNVDVRKKSYKQFLVKNESKAARKKLFLTFFSIESFCLLLQISKHSMSSPDSKVTHILQKIIVKFELGHQNKVLNECSSTLEFFLVKYVHISIFFS